MENLIKQINIAWRRPRAIKETMLKDHGWYDLKDKLLTICNRTEWFDSTEEMIEVVNLYPEALSILNKFEKVYNELRFLYSLENMKIYFSTQKAKYNSYIIARCVLIIYGKRKEFFVSLGVAPCNTDNLDIDLIKIKLKNKAFEFKAKHDMLNN